jgi:hypothetical protein
MTVARPLSLECALNRRNSSSLPSNLGGQSRQFVVIGPHIIVRRNITFVRVEMLCNVRSYWLPLTHTCCSMHWEELRVEMIDAESLEDQSCPTNVR